MEKLHIDHVWELQHTVIKKGTFGSLFPTLTHLEEVPNAVIMASLKPRKYLRGFLCTTIRYSTGIMIIAWISKPAITVAMYMPTIFNDSRMSAIAATFAAIRLQIPIGENLQKNFDN